MPCMLLETGGTMPKRKINKGKTGPKADTVKIAGDWEKAVGKALKKKRPATGWPNPAKKGKS